MGLKDKIEEIRQKPESIRIRYVWGCVAVCMAIIVILWIFSVRASLKENFQQESSLPQSSNENSTTQEGIPSLNSWIQNQNRNQK